MSALEIAAAILFVASSGIFFTDRFRRNKFLVILAGSVAIASTYFLTEQIIDRVVANRIAEVLPHNPTPNTPVPTKPKLPEAPKPLPIEPSHVDDHAAHRVTNPPPSDSDTQPIVAGNVQLQHVAPPSIPENTVSAELSGRWINTAGNEGFWFLPAGRLYWVSKEGWYDDGSTWSRTGSDVVVRYQDGSTIHFTVVASDHLALHLEDGTIDAYLPYFCPHKNDEYEFCANTIYKPDGSTFSPPSN